MMPASNAFSPTVLVYLAVALCARVLVGIHGWSGRADPPMHGDYEAQRHWMEVTWHTPVSQWYHNTTRNDLWYWGLDYPPLTAYVSWVCGALAHALVPELVALDTSHGHETTSGHLYMRWSVILCDVCFFLPAVWLLWRVWHHHNCQSSALKPPALTASSLLCLACPPLLLIDHGHFQFNAVSLGLSLAAFACLAVMGLEGAHTVRGLAHGVLGAVLFVCALLFKQMCLYYALPVFVFVLAVCVASRTHRGWVPVLRAVVVVGLAVVATVAVLLAPLAATHPLQNDIRIHGSSSDPMNVTGRMAEDMDVTDDIVNPDLVAGDINPSSPVGQLGFARLVDTSSGSLVQECEPFYKHCFATPTTASEGTRADLSTGGAGDPVKCLWDAHGVPLRCHGWAWSLRQVLRRVFPFGRGLFEDKVANFWCVSSLVFKWKSSGNVLNIQKSQWPRVTAVCTLLAHLPLLWLLWRAVQQWRRAAGTVHNSTTGQPVSGSSPALDAKGDTMDVAAEGSGESATPSRDKSARSVPPAVDSHRDLLLCFLMALSVGAFLFFLLSFQVHEKSILLALFPLVCLGMLGALPVRFVAGLCLVCNASMFPLLYRGGCGVPYAVCQWVLVCVMVWPMGLQSDTPTGAHTQSDADALTDVTNTEDTHAEDSHTERAPMYVTDWAAGIHRWHSLSQSAWVYALLVVTVVGCHIPFHCMAAPSSLPDLWVMLFMTVCALWMSIGWTVVSWWLWLAGSGRLNHNTGIVRKPHAE